MANHEHSEFVEFLGAFLYHGLLPGLALISLLMLILGIPALFLGGAKRRLKNLVVKWSPRMRRKFIFIAPF